MNNKLLIAFDGSKNAIKAVEYVAGIVCKEVQITLFHVLPKEPPEGIEADDFLSHHSIDFKESVDSLKNSILRKKTAVKQKMNAARNELIAAGVDPGVIEIKIKKRNKDVARDILKEVEKGRYNTIVVGRRGLSSTMAFFSGSVSNKIVQHARDCAVWVVE